MTREEQIAKAASSNATLLEQYGFKAGARWADAHPQSPWVSVKDTLPPTYEKVLICVRKVWPSNAVINPKDYSIELSQRIGYVRKDLKWNVDKYGFPNHGYFNYNVLYWMPIPELPKGGEK